MSSVWTVISIAYSRRFRCDFAPLSHLIGRVSSLSRGTDNEAAKAESRAAGATANTRPRRINRTDAEVIGKFGLTSG